MENLSQKMSHMFFGSSVYWSCVYEGECSERDCFIGKLGVQEFLWNDKVIEALLVMWTLYLAEAGLSVACQLLPPCLRSFAEVAFL